jgi:hypothetical protein
MDFQHILPSNYLKGNPIQRLITEPKHSYAIGSTPRDSFSLFGVLLSKLLLNSNACVHVCLCVCICIYKYLAICMYIQS